MQSMNDLSNCVLHNAITRYSVPRRTTDFELLEIFKSNNDQSITSDYNRRSAFIVRKLNSMMVDQTLLWMDIATRFVYPILADLRIGNTDLAKSKLFAMLAELEKM